MEKFLKKLLVEGYDFLIVAAAGNEENKEYVEDDTAFYGYKSALNLSPEDKSKVKTIKGGTDVQYASFFTCIRDRIVADHIIKVGAIKIVNVMGKLSTMFATCDFSCPGESIDVFAPGEGILSCIPWTETVDKETKCNKRFFNVGNWKCLCLCL